MIGVIMKVYTSAKDLEEIFKLVIEQMNEKENKKCQKEKY